MNRVLSWSSYFGRCMPFKAKPDFPLKESANGRTTSGARGVHTKNKVGKRERNSDKFWLKRPVL